MINPAADPAQSLLAFTRFTYPRYQAEPAHKLIASTLEKVVAGEITRLMIFAPPQHGKSELTSVRLPAYWLGKRPDDPVILTSYGADLAYNKSRQARTIVESDDYRRVFPGIVTRRDSRSVKRWELAAPYRASLLAAGVRGPVTGNGAMLGIIDDPFENWEQAQSPTIREQVRQWWKGTFRTRIWEGGAIILIQTRWHEDDLAGSILQDQADKWTVLRLPALAETQEERDQNNKRLGMPLGQSDPLDREPGDPLCPQRFSEPALQEIKTDVGSLVWTGEYQGAPKAYEGNRFKRDWFKIVDAIPADLTFVRYWDKAGTAEADSKNAAYTAGVLVGGRGKDGLIYIVNVVRGRWSAYQREDVIKQTAQLDRQRTAGRILEIHVEQEPGSGGKESAEATILALQGYSVYADRPSGDKDVRLEPFAAQAEAGNVRLLRGEWNGDYIEEIVSIPNSKFRDQGDGTSGAFNKLALGKSKELHRRPNPFYGGR